MWCSTSRLAACFCARRYRIRYPFEEARNETEKHPSASVNPNSHESLNVGDTVAVIGASVGNEIRAAGFELSTLRRLRKARKLTCFSGRTKFPLKMVASRNELALSFTSVCFHLVYLPTSTM